MTTASKITLVRIVLIPVFMVLLLHHMQTAALIVFLIASCTDFIDGYVARHYNQVSDFGKFLDPLADKMLVISCMVIFVQWGRMAGWIVVAVLAREFAVTGLRLIAVEGGRVIAAAWLGKVKTASTMVGLILMLLIPGSALLDAIVSWVILITTTLSGVEYFVKNWDVFAFGK